MRYAIALFIALTLIFPRNAKAETQENAAAATSRAAIGVIIPEISLTDTNGSVVNLAAYRGKPLLISLVYTACTDVCPSIIENLYPSIEIAQSSLGVDSFSIITVGFDTVNDTPQRMRSFARSRGVDLPNWHFLSGDAASVDALAKAVGFTIVPSAGGFDHMAQVSVVDAKGVIYQQIAGGVFSPPAVVEPLKDLIYDREKPITSLSGIVNRVKLFCTVYNPNTGRYYFNYSLFISLAIGLGCLLFVFGWLLKEFRRSGGVGPGQA
jgi:protein SCO1/2